MENALRLVRYGQLLLARMEKRTCNCRWWQNDQALEHRLTNR